ncbi:protein of unknown function [Microbacterium sp. Nx66]|nr:protein of unknown function [Microbacterium sp. Nx66]
MDAHAAPAAPTAASRHPLGTLRRLNRVVVFCPPKYLQTTVARPRRLKGTLRVRLVSLSQGRQTLIGHQRTVFG